MDRGACIESGHLGRPLTSLADLPPHREDCTHWPIVFRTSSLCSSLRKSPCAHRLRLTLVVSMTRLESVRG